MNGFFSNAAEEQWLTSQPSALTIVDLFPAELLPWNFQPDKPVEKTQPNGRKHPRKGACATGIESVVSSQDDVGLNSFRDTEDDQGISKPITKHQRTTPTHTLRMSQDMVNLDRSSTVNAIRNGLDISEQHIQQSSVIVMDGDGFLQPQKDKKKPGRKPSVNEPSSKRKAQNRAAQRAFRERKERYIKQLEVRVEELESSPLSGSDTGQVDLGNSRPSLAQENARLRAMIQKLEAENYYLKGMSFAFDMSQPSVVSAVCDLAGDDPPGSSGLSIAISFSGAGTVQGTDTSASVKGLGTGFSSGSGYNTPLRLDSAGLDVQAEFDLLLMNALAQPKNQQQLPSPIQHPSLLQNWPLHDDQNNQDRSVSVKMETAVPLVSPLTRIQKSNDRYSMFSVTGTGPSDHAIANLQHSVSHIQPNIPHISATNILKNTKMGAQPLALQPLEGFNASKIQSEATPCSLFTSGSASLPVHIDPLPVMVDFDTYRASSPTGSTDSHSTTQHHYCNSIAVSARPYSAQFNNSLMSLASSGLEEYEPTTDLLDMTGQYNERNINPQIATVGTALQPLSDTIHNTELRQTYAIATLQAEPDPLITSPTFHDNKLICNDPTQNEKLTLSERRAKIYQFLEAQPEDAPAATQWKKALTGFLGEDLLGLDELCDLMVCTFQFLKGFNYYFLYTNAKADFYLKKFTNCSCDQKKQIIREKVEHRKATKSR